MKFVDDAKKAWKWMSVQAMALLGALNILWNGFPGVWAGIPDDFKQALPKGFFTVASLMLLAYGLAGRFVKQGKKDAP